jgi:hypothetical protein
VKTREYFEQIQALAKYTAKLHNGLSARMNDIIKVAQDGLDELTVQDLRKKKAKKDKREAALMVANKTLHELWNQPPPV